MNTVTQKSDNNKNSNNISYKNNLKLQSENIKLIEERQKRIKKIIISCIVGAVVLTTMSYISTQSKDAYNIWLDSGNSGSVQTYMQSLKGNAGDQGDQGKQGGTGETGFSAYEIWKKSDSANFDKTESDYIESLKGSKGASGISAYDNWKNNRPKSLSSTPQDYIDSLKGDVGNKGESAFQYWQRRSPDNKNKTESEYIMALKGAKGDQGDSAYEAWKRDNIDFVDDVSEANYLMSLRGVKGDKGRSAYEAWLESSSDNAGKTVSDYLFSLKGDQGDTGAKGGFQIGEIRSFTSTVDEEGWILCDGSSFDPIRYNDLFNMIGDDKVPDLRGRTIAMSNRTNTPGTQGGYNELLLTKEHLPNKTYSFDISHGHTLPKDIKTSTDGAHKHGWTVDISTGSGNKYELGPNSNTSDPITPDELKLNENGSHAHSLDTYNMYQNESTKPIYINNTGSQKPVDNRQPTYYVAQYIFAGYNK